MIKKILFILAIIILILLLKKGKLELFSNLLDPNYHILSIDNQKDFYTRFLDYFHYGKPSIYPLNIYNYPMNYIKSPFIQYNNPYVSPLLRYPVRTTTYEIKNIKNPYDYSYHIVDKDGNLHLLDYKSNPKILTNENFYEQVWMNPDDKKILFIPK